MYMCPVYKTEFRGPTPFLREPQNEVGGGALAGVAVYALHHWSCYVPFTGEQQFDRRTVRARRSAP